MINLHTLSVSDYNKLLAKLLGTFESDSATAYFDSKSPNKHVTIGRGFDIEPTDSLAQQKVFATMGLNQSTGLTPAADAAEKAYVAQIVGVLTGPDTTDASLQASLNQIMANRAVDPLFTGITAITSQTTFTLTPAQIESTYSAIIEDKEKVIDRVIASRSSLPLSSERAILVAMAYQGLVPSRSAALKAAIVADSNRAEAWYLIRYEGYMSANDGPGQAKRHFVEAQAFGLYDNAAAVTVDEAKQTFAMLRKHRANILAYEARYGVPPDGTTATRNAIAEALLDANLRSIAQPQEILAALYPAKDAFITWVNSQLPSGIASLDAADWNAAAIFYSSHGIAMDDGSFNPTLDAQSLDGKAAGMDKNLMVGGTGGNIMLGGQGDDFLLGNASADWLVGGDHKDTLVGGGGLDTLEGGKDDDILYGGAGDDIYIWNVGDGNDTIVDTEGNNRIIINGTDYIFGGGIMIKEGGSNLWKDPTGKVILTHNSSWRLELADGSVIQLGENFNPDQWHIKLQDDSAAASTTRTILGDLALLDLDPIAPGLQYGHDDLGNLVTDVNQAELGRIDELYDSGGNDDIRAGGGNDWIEAVRGGDDRLDGGAGDDIVTAGAGNDIIIGAQGMDLLSGDAGDDEIYAGTQTSLDGALAAQEGTASGLNGDFIDGGEGQDVLMGDAGNDALNGGAGSDVIVGGAGDDTIQGDLKINNVVRQWSIERTIRDTSAGTAYRTIYTGVNFSVPTVGGADVIYAGAGADWVHGELGDDTIDGGSGGDVLFGDEGNDLVIGGMGNDVLAGDNYTGEQGDDYLDGGDGDDTLDAGGGNDYVIGGNGRDTLYGGDGDDTLELDAGDRAYGGKGQDIYLISGNAEIIADAHGRNLYRIDAAKASSLRIEDTAKSGSQIEVFNSSGAVVAPILTASNNDQILTIGNLTITGTGWLDGSLASISVNNTVYTANDIRANSAIAQSVVLTESSTELKTGAGADDIRVQGSDNIIAPGKGNDQLVIESSGNTVQIQEQSGVDTIFVSSTVLEAQTALTLELDAGQDLSELRLGLVQGPPTGWQVALYLDASSENYVKLDLSNADVDQFLDRLVVTAGAQVSTFAALLEAGQVLQGNDKDNQLVAFKRSSVLSGYGGNDILTGSDFDDVLDGGGGNDYLEGGLGDDTYKWGLGGGNDSLVDAGGFDSLNLTNLLESDVFVRRSYSGSLMLTARSSGETLEISYGFPTEFPEAAIERVVFSDGVVWDTNAIQLQSLRGTDSSDSLYGSIGDDVLRGGAGDDYLDGSGGNDLLEGGEGGDSLRGGDGDDRLIGGVGIDFLMGDGGADTYVWGVGDGNDYIYDFGDMSNDRVEFSGLNPQDLTMVRYNYGEAELTINATGEKLTITQDFYNLEYYHIESLVFANGSVWNSEMQSLNIPLVGRRYGDGSVDSNLIGWALGDLIVGSSIEDSLHGGEGNDVLDGGEGVDYVYGGPGDDTYIWGVGRGDDIISDYDSYYEWIGGGGGFDTLKLLDLNAADVVVTKDSETYDLYVSIKTTGELLTVRAGFDQSSDYWPLGRILFQDGSVWNATDIRVHAGNVAPILSDGPAIMAAGNEDSGYSISEDDLLVGFSDADGDHLSVKNLHTSHGSLSDYNAVSRTWTFTPNANYNGVVNLSYEVTDGIEVTAAAQSLNLVAMNDAPTGSVTVHGETKVGRILSATNTLADVDGMGQLTYQWQMSNGDGTWSAIPGATTDSLTLANAQVGKQLRVNITYTDGYGAVEEVASVATTAVTAALQNFVGTLGADIISGTGQADQMEGLTGNDIYIVNSIDDVVVELADEGTDTVQSLVDYTLGANLENLTLTGAAATSGTGNELGNVITGNAAGNTLRGLGGNDTLRGGAEADILEGGEGNDRLDGGAGADTYLFGRGDGQDTLVDTDATVGAQDALHFGHDISAEQIWLRKLGNNLEISLIGTADKVTVSNWYLGVDHHVEILELTGGQRLLDSQVQNLVDAMAAFAPPAAGQTILPENYATSLNSVIAANWQ